MPDKKINNIHKYGNSFDDGKRYGDDLRYWSNACGELHKWGMADITEEALPLPLQTAYNTLWEENKDGNYCYLAEYKGNYGIALVNEYYEMTPEGDTGEPNNYKRAEYVADLMSRLFDDITVLLAKQQGIDANAHNDPASEVVVFVDTSIAKQRFDEVSKKLAEVAYI